jgi:hypothetical protein
LPVLNAVSYSPQQSLWKRLYPSGSQRVLYNRYQRLMLVLAPMRDGADYRIDSPRLDEVRVRLDPARFDFRRLGASLVLTTERDAEALAANASLHRVSSGGGCVLHRVVQ